MQKNGSYHRSCYKEFSKRSKLDRVIDRFQKAVQHKKSSLSQNKIGRPSLGTISTPVNKSDTPKTLRSSSGIFDKTMCIICQKPGEKLNEVQYKATGKTMLSVATKHYNDRVLRRLNSIAASDDCVATDAKYHFKCWVLMKRYVQQKDNSIETQEIENICYVVADIKTISILKQESDDPSHKSVTTVSVEILYRELLLELGVKKEDLHNSYSDVYRVFFGRLVTSWSSPSPFPPPSFAEIFKPCASRCSKNALSGHACS